MCDDILVLMWLVERCLNPKTLNPKPYDMLVLMRLVERCAGTLNVRLYQVVGRGL